MKRSLRKHLQHFFGVDHIFPVGSGTVGLTIALNLANAKGKDVIIPAFTCPNVAVAVMAAGGSPVVADVSPKTLSLTPDTVQDVLHRDTAAIVAVDAFGCPAPIEDLVCLVEETTCTVIDDACQAYGGSYRGTSLGTRGDLGVVSFGYRKPVSVNAGGLLITRSDTVADQLQDFLCRSLSSQFAHLRNEIALRLMKRDSPRWHSRLGSVLGLFNYAFPPNNLTGLERHWNEFVEGLEQAKQCLTELREFLQDFPYVKAVLPQSESDWLPWRLSIYVENGENRSALREQLAQTGVSTSTLYKPVTEYDWDLQQSSDLSAAFDLHRHIINIRHGQTPRSIAETLNSLRVAHDCIHDSI